MLNRFFLLAAIPIVFLTEANATLVCPPNVYPIPPSCNGLTKEKIDQAIQASNQACLSQPTYREQQQCFGAMPEGYSHNYKFGSGDPIVLDLKPRSNHDPKTDPTQSEDEPICFKRSDNGEEVSTKGEPKPPFK